MLKFGKAIAKWRWPILVLSLALLLPSILGMAKTRINYDMLDYLPSSMETVKGQDILMDEFGKGAFSFVVVEGMDDRDVAKLKTEIESVDHVDTVLWYDSYLDLSVPKEALPDSIYEKFNSGDTTLLAVFFDTSTSADETMKTLLDKTNELASGVQELADAVKQLDSGSATLYNGSVSLRDNLKTLQTGLGKLSGSSASLNAGAKQVFQSLLDQANAQIKASGASIPTLTIDNYDQVLSSVSVENVTKTATATAKTQVTAKVKANETAITTAVTQGVQVGVTAKVLAAATQGKIAVTVPDNATQDQLQQIGTQLTAAIGQLSADQQKAVTDAVAAQMATADVQTLIASKVAAQEELLIEQGML